MSKCEEIVQKSNLNYKIDYPDTFANLLFLFNEKLEYKARVIMSDDDVRVLAIETFDDEAIVLSLEYTDEDDDYIETVINKVKDFQLPYNLGLSYPEAPVRVEGYDDCELLVLMVDDSEETVWFCITPIDTDKIEPQ